MSGIGEMPEPGGEPAEQPDPEDERADLDEDERAVVHLGVSRSGDDADEVVEAVAGADGDDACRRCARRSAGAGAGSTSVSRTIATMEHRVRVRAFVSPSGRPTYGESARTGICSIDSPATCSRSPASWVEDQRAAEHLATARWPRRRSARWSRSARSGSSSSARASSRPPSRRLRTDSRRPSSVTMSWRTPIPGQFGALDVGWHASIIAPASTAGRMPSHRAARRSRLPRCSLARRRESRRACAVATRRSPKGPSVTDMSDPDVPGMKPDLPQFSGLTPTTRWPSARGRGGSVEHAQAGRAAWGLWDWGSAAFNAVVTTFVFTVYLTSSSFGPDGHGRGAARLGARRMPASSSPCSRRSPVSAPIPRAPQALARGEHLHRRARSRAMFFVQPDPSFLLVRAVPRRGRQRLLRDRGRQLQRDARRRCRLPARSAGSAARLGHRLHRRHRAAAGRLLRLHPGGGPVRRPR